MPLIRIPESDRAAQSHCPPSQFTAAFSPGLQCPVNQDLPDGGLGRLLLAGAAIGFPIGACRGDVRIRNVLNVAFGK
jgi:hypothetical protein